MSGNSLGEAESSEGSEVDDDVIIEGSHLQKYLLDCTNENFETFKPFSDEFSFWNHPTQLLGRKVDEDSLKLMQIVLNSNLLFEEDASYVYQVISDTVAQPKPIWFSIEVAVFILLIELLLIGALILFYELFGCTIWIMLTVIASIFSELIDIIWWIYTSYKNQKILENDIFPILRTVHPDLRNVLQIVSKDLALISSKETEYRMKGKHTYSEILHYQRRVTSLNLLTWRTRSCLKRMILAGRHASQELIIFKPQSERLDVKGSYALCNDEELSIGSDPNELLPESYHCSLTKLHKLENTYFVVQSDFLRIFALQILEPDAIPNLMSIIQNFSKEISSILTELNNHITCYKHRPFIALQKAYDPVKRFDKAEYLMFKSLFNSFNSTQLSMRHLEDYVNDIRIHLVSRYDVARESFDRLCLLEDDLEFLTQQIKNAKKHFLKISSKKNMPATVQKTDISSSLESLEETPEAKILTGTSEAINQNEDEVYLATTDAQVHAEYEQEEAEFYDDVKPPRRLIRELRIALATKRRECVARELRVLQTQEEKDAYQESESVEPNESVSDQHTSFSYTFTSDDAKGDSSDYFFVNDHELGIVRRKVIFGEKNLKPRASEVSDSSDSHTKSHRTIESSVEQEVAAMASSIAAQWKTMQKEVSFDNFEHSDTNDETRFK